MNKQVPGHQDVRERGGIASRILNIGCTRNWVVSFTPRPLYPSWKRAGIRCNRSLCGSQNMSGRGSLTLCEIEPRFSTM